ncbi:ribosomal protein S18-alanine N-acetyltransferase [Sphingomonas sp.]|jgi:ribosomal-protein-alanine N-acetyltransferase|uniref:ribosomal protein S18-alanine N-acetyltransferase n=1 Tax=Sphingomonas sp. TaxID=28214 RepID=UPI002E30E1C8|nr:ribosomal protein S18-alanine N-acetyltransferase [Sphingomonas sp.]HEX4695998.1 ribosomal protein S18-alanine N-acetyltransferase [Sphingomonas sp.]
MSTAALELREGDIRDLDRVDRVMAQAFDPRWGEAWTRNQMIGILAVPGVWLTIAELGGRTAGFALTRGVLDEAELLLLAVVPEMRRGGVGAALLRSVIADCASRGIASLHLEVRDGNDAIKLYRNSGFSKVGERRDYYRGADGHNYSALTLRRATR